MARIRTIKPDFWRNENLSTLPEATHLLAAALLNYADDEGYFNANPHLIKAECSPLREPSVSIPDSLIALSGIGYIRLGQGADGKRYGHIVKFLDYQKVSHPMASKIKDMEVAWDGSGNTHGGFTEASVSAPVSLSPELKGTEGKGKGNRIEGGADAPQTNGKIAFDGLVAKVTAKDLETWRRTYYAVPDIEAELRAADAYYADHPPKGGKWFFHMSSWLKRVHVEALERRKSRDGPSATVDPRL